MHSPSARALHHPERYCIILVHTLKHLLPDKCVILKLGTGLHKLSSTFLPQENQIYPRWDL